MGHHNSAASKQKSLEKFVKSNCVKNLLKMTTAARPTFDTARGGSGQRERDLSALSKQYSSRDLPSHTSLKYRERVASIEKQRERGRGRLVDKAKEEIEEKPAKRLKVEPQNLDADDPLDESDTGDSDSDSDDDDETAALMAELQKIKREKAAEEQEKEEKRNQDEERIRMENILSGNPLLKEKYSGSGSEKTDMKVKRRWDDDVVFKNCSRAEPDKSEKTFINDSLRSDFHRKFMDKYIK